MKVLCLYNNDCALELFEWLQKQGHETVRCSERFSAAWCAEQGFDLTVSYTYRYILSKTHLEALNYNAVNLHNSFLPWNRGADPNIWSIIDGTPRGVTLHYMNEDLDKGYIIAQRFVPLKSEDTMASSYYALDKAAKDLFIEAFQFYPYWNEMKKQAVGHGSYHATADGEKVKKLITSYDGMLASELKERFVRGGAALCDRFVCAERTAARYAA